MAILYRHIRLDKNEPFYIGIGKDEKRMNSRKSRNVYWKNITQKTDWFSEVVLDDLTWEEACEKEKEFIALYGRKDLGTGILCNMTDGGDGFLSLSEESRNRAICNMKKTLSNKIYDDEARQRSRLSSMGNKNMLGKKHSIESRAKISLSNIGNKNMLGKKHSMESRKRMSDSGVGKGGRIILDLETGIFYNTITELSNLLSIPNTTLNRHLKLGKYKNKYEII